MISIPGFTKWFPSGDKSNFKRDLSLRQTRCLRYISNRKLIEHCIHLSLPFYQAPRITAWSRYTMSITQPHNMYDSVINPTRIPIRDLITSGPYTAQIAKLGRIYKSLSVIFSSVLFPLLIYFFSRYQFSVGKRRKKYAFHRNQINCLI